MPSDIGLLQNNRTKTRPSENKNLSDRLLWGIELLSFGQTPKLSEKSAKCPKMSEKSCILFYAKLLNLSDLSKS